MATLKLQWGASEIDLLTGDLKLLRNRWKTAGHSGGEPVVETLALVGQDAASDPRPGAEVELEEYLSAARRYHRDYGYSDPVWLRFQAENEINARRALVYGGRTEIQARRGSSPLLTSPGMWLQAAVERHPAWENVAFSDVSQSISGWGGVVRYTADGVLPARMAETQLRGTVSGGGPIYRAWLGVRAQYEGDSSFDPVWELEDGTMGTDASVSTDSGASGGERVTVSFATTSMAKRVGITLDDVTGGTDSDHFIGQYLVLVRCKMTSGACNLQLRHGYWADDSVARNEIVYDVDNTDWRLIPLGLMDIPPVGRPGYSLDPQFLDGVEASIWAERASGSGSLYLDAICLIPSRHSFHASRLWVQTVLYNDRPLRVIVNPDDSIQAMNEVGSVLLSVDFYPRDWQLPVGSGLFVLAAERETQHVLTDSVSLEVDYHPRWPVYRNS